jgi:hypothetical protein
MSSLDLAADPEQASAAASADPLSQPWLARSSRRSSRRRVGQLALALEA